MLPKNKQGTILIPLVVILFVSFCVFGASKYFSTSQANVESAIDSRYQLTPSKHMDEPSLWVKEENKEYDFIFYYPKQWVASQASKPTGSELFTTQKGLSTKITLKVSVLRQMEVPEGNKKAKFDKNTFLLLEDTDTKKSAAMETKGRFYKLELTQNNYFPDELEFKSAFFLILKKFQLTE